MPCNDCGENRLINGHCNTPGCDNKMPAIVLTPKKRKPRTPIAKQSAKQRQIYKQTKPSRHGPIKNGQICDCCQEVPAQDPHEITAGSHRRRALQDVRAISWLCRDCHRFMQGMPYAKQIAIVVRSIIASVNRCCGREAADLLFMPRDTPSEQ